MGRCNHPRVTQREGSFGLYLAGLVYPQRRVYTHREGGGQASDIHCEILQVTLSERVSLLVGGLYHLSSLRCAACAELGCVVSPSPSRSQRHPETMCAACFFFFKVTFDLGCQASKCKVNFSYLIEAIKYTVWIRNHKKWSYAKCAFYLSLYSSRACSGKGRSCTVSWVPHVE